MLELKVRDGSLEVKLRFEHSLLSLSKWEAEHKKPFLTANRNAYEMVDYYKAMLVDDVDPNLVYALSPEQLERMGTYINEVRSATSVPKDGRPSGEVVTSELIYYWLTELKIAFQPTEEWHLSRVMKLIEVVNYKRQPPKKQRNASFKQQWLAANAANKKRFNSNG